jgi:hypothetical protein
MRLWERDGVQHLSLNPFGSYYGQQLDYTYMGGNGIGTEFARLGSAALRPNGPSFNGQVQRFSLLLAPYAGDKPPSSPQDDAAAFFYPCGAVYLRTPSGVDAVLPDDIRDLVTAKVKERQVMSMAPLLPPTAFLANPSDMAADVVWDEPGDGRITDYAVRYRRAAEDPWHIHTVSSAHRLHVPSLENGARYVLQLRAVGHGRDSVWTHPVECVPGPEQKRGSALTFMRGVSGGTLLRLAYHGLRHGWRTRGR